MPLPLLLLAAAAINLNQVGFRPADPRQAVIADAATRPLGWQVIDKGGRVVLHGADACEAGTRRL